MSIVLKVIGIIVVVLYAAFNLITAKLMNAKEMKEDFIDGQCTVGMVFANLFYAPAWVLKFLRLIIVTLVK